MNKRKIFIASILKPVNEVRMYKKIGISLAKFSDNEIHIAGFQSNISDHQNIFFYPLFSFSRLNIKRLLAPFKILRLLLKVKPQIIIICTHELLWAACIYKIFNKTKLIYDVQENYYRNIIYNPYYPPVLKHLLALMIRMKEYITRPLVDMYFLAEKNYEKEFQFTKNKSIILENKYLKNEHDKVKANTPIKLSKTAPLKLLYSGTIASNYGIWESIELIDKIYQIHPNASLTIIGYSANPTLITQIKLNIQNKPYVNLITDKKPIAHELIIHEIEKANIGLIAYQDNPSTNNCIPTKLYEYLAFKLPILLTKNNLWKEICFRYQACISIDYKNDPANIILEKIFSSTFYTTSPGEEVLWSGEEIKLTAQTSAL